MVVYVQALRPTQFEEMSGVTRYDMRRYYSIAGIWRSAALNDWMVHLRATEYCNSRWRQRGDRSQRETSGVVVVS